MSQRFLIPIRRLVVALLAPLLVAAGVHAADSRLTITFQGAVAVKPGQQPLDGQPYNGRFVLYSAATGGTLLYDDVLPVNISNGAFAVELGSGAGKPLYPETFKQFNDAWLEITLDLNRDSVYGADERMDPRIHLSAAAYALTSYYAVRADTATQADNATNAQTAASANTATTANSANSANIANSASFATNAGTANTAISANSADSIKLPATLRDGSSNETIILSDTGAIVSRKNLGDNSTPTRGAMYRDSAPIAWGYISSAGDLVAGFGISSVSYNQDDDYYEIQLRNDVDTTSYDGDDVYSYSVSLASQGDSGQIEVMTYEPRSATRFRVRIFAIDLAAVTNNDRLLVPRVASAFSVTVFGRPN